jgi:uncharacterized protein
MTLSMRAPANLVSPRAILFWTVRAGLGWLVLLVVQLVILIFGGLGSRSLSAILLAVTVVLAAIHLLVMPRWRYRVHRWELTGSACYAQSGWITQHRRIAPLSRIQTVDTERGPLEQIFSLANVTITTASAAGPITINGLDAATASRLVSDLTVAAEASTGDAT